MTPLGTLPSHTEHFTPTTTIHPFQLHNHSTMQSPPAIRTTTTTPHQLVHQTETTTQSQELERHKPHKKRHRRTKDKKRRRRSRDTVTSTSSDDDHDDKQQHHQATQPILPPPPQTWHQAERESQPNHIVMNNDGSQPIAQDEYGNITDSLYSLTDEQMDELMNEPLITGHIQAPSWDDIKDFLLKHKHTIHVREFLSTHFHTDDFSHSTLDPEKPPHNRIDNIQYHKALNEAMVHRCLPLVPRTQHSYWKTPGIRPVPLTRVQRSLFFQQTNSTRSPQQ